MDQLIGTGVPLCHINRSQYSGYYTLLSTSPSRNSRIYEHIRVLRRTKLTGIIFLNAINVHVFVTELQIGWCTVGIIMQVNLVHQRVVATRPTN